MSPKFSKSLWQQQQQQQQPMLGKTDSNLENKRKWIHEKSTRAHKQPIKSKLTSMSFMCFLYSYLSFLFFLVILYLRRYITCIVIHPKTIYLYTYACLRSNVWAGAILLMHLRRCLIDVWIYRQVHRLHRPSRLAVHHHHHLSLHLCHRRRCSCQTL